MDALAQLALMTKAKLLFENPDSFLSFPALTPISFAADNLNFANASTPGQMNAFADFSRWTNALPHGTIFQPDLDTLLWDVYLGVLQNAEVAQGVLTAEQTDALAAAQSCLSTPGPDGLNVDTPALVTYKQYQQAYFAANETYNNLKITATASADPAVQAAWQNGGEASARTQLQTVESDWENKGFKAQVEQAQLTETTLGALSPQLKWTEWIKQCDPVLDFPVSPGSNAPFGATLFEPYDVIEHGSWSSFTINGPDIPNLVAQAPDELKNIFSSTAGTSTITSISFEYCSVAVARPWFASQIFSSRFWKLPDANVQLSDGNDPPTGNWPSYVNAVVFARNINITTQAQSQAPPPPHFYPIPVTIFKPLPPPERVTTPIVLHPRVPIGPIGEPGFHGGGIPHPINGPHPVMMRMMEPQIRPAIAEPIAPGAVAPIIRPIQATTIDPAVRARLMNENFGHVLITNFGGNGTTPQPTPTPAPTQMTSGGSDVSVLAFICKRLPKCPDPDLSLQWS